MMIREYITSLRFLVARSIVLPFLPDCGAGAAENNPSGVPFGRARNKKIVPFLRISVNLSAPGPPFMITNAPPRIF